MLRERKSVLHKLNKLLCRIFDHKWDEFHMYDVVCSRCYTSRAWTEEDEENYDRKVRGL